MVRVTLVFPEITAYTVDEAWDVVKDFIADGIINPEVEKIEFTEPEDE